MMEKKLDTISALDLIRMGRNFLGILNDIKRRPEDAATELGISVEEINSIINGTKAISSEIISRAAKIWPVNERDFYIIHDDCPTGVRIMRYDESKKSSRIMMRAGKPYYEYRDTAMSKVAPFRPEWIMELCYVNDNEPDNTEVQWNNGHFMHQFTYFIGEVNFYYKGNNDEKKIAVMNTGDSMYITPFVPHTFATRKGAKENGLILALTYGSKLTGDTQQELSSLSNLGSEFALDFSTKEKAFSSLLKYFLGISSIPINELSKRTHISKQKLQDIIDGKLIPSSFELKQLGEELNLSIRDLMPNDKTEDKVIVKYHTDCKKWFYPEKTKTYEFVELASSTTLPYSKAFEILVQNSNNYDFDLKVGSHQYVYNVGDSEVILNWKLNEKTYHEKINPGDSAYIKPFVNHNFRQEGKLLVLRIGGKIAGDSQRELSFIGKSNAIRAISETMQWFEPQGKQ